MRAVDVREVLTQAELEVSGDYYYRFYRYERAIWDKAEDGLDNADY